MDSNEGFDLMDIISMEQALALHAIRNFKLQL